MAQIGNTVRFLNSVGGGVIIKIEGNIAHVEDADGFVTPILLRECVVVNTDASKKSFFDRPEELSRAKNAPKIAKEEEPTVSKYIEPEPANPELVIEETPEGDSMNIVLAFEPLNQKNLSATRFAIYLVNDSNYFIQFTLLTRDESSWKLYKSETVEPNIQLSLGEISHEELPHISQIAFQAIAYKLDKEFNIKNPINYHHKFDGTKFYKLHTFRESDYFDVPVLEIPIVLNDVPQRQVEINPEQIQKSIAGKSDNKPAAKPAQSKPSEKHSQKVEVVDLHIHELLDDITGLSNADMLQVQLGEFKKVMDTHKSHKGKRIVFIHGKGEGVLRKAITDELKRHYPRCEWHDASFREYGFGATEVVVH